MLIVGVVLSGLGFGGAGGAFVGIAKILFFLAIALFADRAISDAFQMLILETRLRHALCAAALIGYGGWS